MRIDLDNCRDPDLLAGEVRRLRAVIASEQTLTDAEREAVEMAIDSMNGVEDISASWSQRETAAIATLRGLLQRQVFLRKNLTDPRLAVLQKLTELDEELSLPRRRSQRHDSETWVKNEGFATGDEP